MDGARGKTDSAFRGARSEGHRPASSPGANTPQIARRRETVFPIAGAGRKTLAFALVFAVLGCGVKRVELTREAASSVDSTGVAQGQGPDAFLIQHHGGSGSCFGAIGAAASLSTAGDVEKRSTEMAVAMNFDPGAEFDRMLLEAVSAAGFRTASLEVARAGPGKLMGDPGSIDAKGADAILDVAIENLGYATQHPMTSPYWRPAARTHVAIIHVRSRERIYAETFMYGYHDPMIGGTDLEAPETYRFEDENALLSSNERMVEGLQDSMRTVAEEVAGRLNGSR